jgi:CheY-like chemotaxis protein
LRPEHEEQKAQLPTEQGFILIAEDNKVNQLIAKSILEGAGYKVLQAYNGKQALELYQTNKPDLILMDVHMPEMDGYEATRAIRQWEFTQELNPVPVVAITANALLGDDKKCLGAGMTDYLPKPFREKDLLKIVKLQLANLPVTSAAPKATSEETLELSVVQQPPQPQQKPPVTSPPHLEKGEPMTVEKISGWNTPDAPIPQQPLTQWIEAQSLAQRLGGNLDDLGDIIELLVETAQEMLPEIKSAIELGDASRLQFTAHTLKGAIANFTQEGPYHHALALEKSGANNSIDSAQAMAVYAQLTQTFEEVLSELKQLATTA